VRSKGRSGLPLRDRPETKPVLVSLDALFPAADQPVTARNWRAGQLMPSTDGFGPQPAWIGVCTVLIERTDGTVYKAEDQVIPALPPRDDGAARKRP
jgi:hypothetical protein